MSTIVIPSTLSRTSSIGYVRRACAWRALANLRAQDDKQSLAELHDYLNSDAPSPLLAFAAARYATDSPSDGQTPTGIVPGEIPETPRSARAERRHSLPARASIASLRSEYLCAPEPDAQAFGARRRRAQKLAAFFGASYNELVGDVLESIAVGMRDEMDRGTLNPEEMVSLRRARAAHW
jgi:hypothetical protein